MKVRRTCVTRTSDKGKTLTITLTGEEADAFIEGKREVVKRVVQMDDELRSRITEDHKWIEAESDSMALFSDMKISETREGEVVHVEDPRQGKLPLSDAGEQKPKPKRKAKKDVA